MELLVPTGAIAALDGMMGRDMVGGGMMAGMGIFWVLLLVALVLGIVLMARGLSRDRR